MSIMQAYNPRTKKYIKYEIKKNSPQKIVNQTADGKPFKGVPFKNKKKA
jgi:hypothetical protein